MKESECHQLWMSAISCLLRLFHGIFILASKLWHRSLFTSQIEWNKKLSVSASQNPLVLPVPPCQAHLGILFFFSFLLTKNNWKLYPPARAFLTKCSTWISAVLGWGTTKEPSVAQTPPDFHHTSIPDGKFWGVSRGFYIYNFPSAVWLIV